MDMKPLDWVGSARVSVLSSLSLTLGYSALYAIQGFRSGKLVYSVLVRDGLEVAGVMALMVFILALVVNWLFAQANLDELM
jgi:hypothetical protein